MILGYINKTEAITGQFPTQVNKRVATMDLSTQDLTKCQFKLFFSLYSIIFLRILHLLFVSTTKMLATSTNFGFLESQILLILSICRPCVLKRKIWMLFS